jgi:UDP-N-acetylmuramyl tripeptide synthase
MAWTVEGDAVRGPEGSTPVRLALPGRFNLGNAAMSVATADALGVAPAAAAAAISGVTSIAGRYSVLERGPHLLRLLLAKNPAGWSELLPLLAGAPALLLVINAQEADGRDTSWLWDVPFEQLSVPCVVASGERAADVGLRLSYAGIPHTTEPDPLVALRRMPPGEVQIVGNYTAFLGLRRRLSAGTTS